jgi:uncharacterized membrane protein
MPMYMVKERLAQFKANTRAFFKNEDGSWNKQSVFAILIGGFIGWLLITVTFGMRLKRMLKKVPVINMLFKKKVVTRRTRARRASNPVPVTAYEEGLTKKQLIAYRARRRRTQAKSRRR